MRYPWVQPGDVNPMGYVALEVRPRNTNSFQFISGTEIINHPHCGSVNWYMDLLWIVHKKSGLTNLDRWEHLSSIVITQPFSMYQCYHVLPQFPQSCGPQENRDSQHGMEWGSIFLRGLQIGGISLFDSQPISWRWMFIDPNVIWNASVIWNAQATKEKTHATAYQGGSLISLLSLLPCLGLHFCTAGCPKSFGKGEGQDLHQYSLGS